MFLPMIRRFKNFFLKNLVNIDKLTKLFFRHHLVCSSQHRARKMMVMESFEKERKTAVIQGSLSAIFLITVYHYHSNLMIYPIFLERLNSK